MGARPLPILLDLIGAKPTDPFIMVRVVEAHHAGRITNTEARHLQSFERRSPRSRKRALADAVDASPEAFTKLRAKLDAVSAEFHAQYPHLRREDDA